jgi:hypothetical protein
VSIPDDRANGVDEAALAMADELAADAASFVAAVESVAAGANPSAAVSVLILALSGVLSAGAKLGAQEDVGTAAVEPEEGIAGAAALGEGQSTGALRSALAEQFGGVDQYWEAVDPYLGQEVAAARLSDDLAAIAGDLLQGLSLYSEGRYADAMAWWQYSYLAGWGPAASACLRAVQSLIAMVRLGAPMGSPGEDLPG